MQTTGARCSARELQHERSNGASLIVETEGEKLQEMVITECALAESFAPVRSVVDTNYGEDDPIIDSGCGQSIYPQSWLQRLGETLKLRPVRLQLRAANGGKMGMLGTTTMKFRLPGTTEWVNHDVMVADKGAIPDHIHILGNDFLKKMKASMDWTEEKLTGTTPSGESFTARMRMGGNKPSWCGAVDGAEEHEVQGSQLKRGGWSSHTDARMQAAARRITANRHARMGTSTSRTGVYALDTGTNNDGRRSCRSNATSLLPGRGGCGGIGSDELDGQGNGIACRRQNGNTRSGHATRSQ